MFKNFWKDESGQDLVEYALVVGILALGCLVMMNSAGGYIKGMWTTLSAALGNANTQMTAAS